MWQIGKPPAFARSEVLRAATLLNHAEETVMVTLVLNTYG